MATKWSSVSLKISVTHLNNSPTVSFLGVRTFL